MPAAALRRIEELAEELGDARLGESIALDDADRLTTCLVLAIDERREPRARRWMLQASPVREHADPAPTAAHVRQLFRNRVCWPAAIVCERDTMPRR